MGRDLSDEQEAIERPDREALSAIGGGGALPDPDLIPLPTDVKEPMPTNPVEPPGN
jgi:hypothetical protein